MYVNQIVINEIKRIILESTILQQDDSKWVRPNKNGTQELEITIANQSISFTTTKFGSSVDILQSADPQGMEVFYYLVQDLKTLIFSLISEINEAASVGVRTPAVSHKFNVDIPSEITVLITE